ncbi:retrovirus-related pol polyprotein from transposon TNT 1-94 [Tanacetum coccineum]
MKCPQYYLIEMQEVILLYNRLNVPTRQILDSKGVIPTKTVAEAKVAIQEMDEYSHKWHNGTYRTRSTKTSDRQYRAAASGFYQRNNANPSYQEQRQSMEESLRKFMNESTKRHEENSNLIKEIWASTDAAIRNQGASIKTLEIQIRQMSKVLQERGFGSLPSSTETNPRDHVKSISTTVEADITLIRPNSYGAPQIDNSIPRKEKDPESFTLPYYINNVCFDNALDDLGANVSGMPLSTDLNLGLGELAHTNLTVELTDRTVKYLKGIAKNVLLEIGKFVFPIDFIILDMPEDVKVPLILRRPVLSTTHAKIDVFKRNITLRVGDEKIIFKSMKPASSLIKRVYMLGLRECMELDLEATIMGETLVLNRSLDPSYGDYIELNDLNVSLELRRDQVDDFMPTIEEGEIIDEPMIDIIKTMNDESLTIVENMDGYRDQDMEDIILGEPFCKASCMKARRFDGLITIHNGNDNVTYQMTRSHPRFKHLSNAQCNKIKPLLKVSMHDKLNGISHPYQKLKSFYKGWFEQFYTRIK